MSRLAGPEAVAAVEALCCAGGGRGGQRVQPRGLTNPGNLCFMNATLQVLVVLLHRPSLVSDTTQTRLTNSFRMLGKQPNAV